MLHVFTVKLGIFCISSTHYSWIKVIFFMAFSSRIVIFTFPSLGKSLEKYTKQEIKIFRVLEVLQMIEKKYFAFTYSDKPSSCLHFFFPVLFFSNFWTSIEIVSQPEAWCLQQTHNAKYKHTHAHTHTHIYGYLYRYIYIDR